MSSIEACALLVLLSALGATSTESMTLAQCANSASSECFDDETSFVQTRVVHFKQHDTSNDTALTQSNVTKHSSLVQVLEDPATNEQLCEGYEALPKPKGKCTLQGKIFEKNNRHGNAAHEALVYCEVHNVQPTQVVSYQIKWDANSVPDCSGAPPTAHLRDQVCRGDHVGPASTGSSGDGWVVDRNQMNDDKPIGDRDAEGPYFVPKEGASEEIGDMSDPYPQYLGNKDSKCGSIFSFRDNMANSPPKMNGKWYFRARVLGLKKGPKTWTQWFQGLESTKWIFTTDFTSNVVEVDWGSL